MPAVAMARLKPASMIEISLLTAAIDACLGANTSARVPPVPALPAAKPSMSRLICAKTGPVLLFAEISTNSCARRSPAMGQLLVENESILEKPFKACENFRGIFSETLQVRHGFRGFLGGEQNQAGGERLRFWDSYF